MANFFNMTHHIWWMIAGIILVISGISSATPAKGHIEDPGLSKAESNYIYPTFLFTAGWMCLLIVLLTTDNYKYILDTHTLIILLAVSIIIAVFDTVGFIKTDPDGLKNPAALFPYVMGFIILGFAISYEKPNISKWMAAIAVALILISEFIIIPKQIKNENVIGVGMPMLTVGYILLILSGTIVIQPLY